MFLLLLLPYRSNDDKRSREHDRERKVRSDERRRRSRWEDKETDERSKDRDGRMTKTLDGKTAGLQDAKALREETEAHRRREAEQFSRVSILAFCVPLIDVNVYGATADRSLQASSRICFS